MTGRYSKRKRNNESTWCQQRPETPAPSKSILLRVASAFRRKHLLDAQARALGGSPRQTFACEPFVHLNRTIELRKIQMLLAGMGDEKRSRSEQQRRSPPVEKRNVGGEWECRRRQSRHRMQLHDRHAQYLF